MMIVKKDFSLNSYSLDKYTLNIVDELNAGDLIIVNDTKVMKARIFGAGSIGNHLSNALRNFNYKVEVIDIDKNATSIGKQRLFSHYKNVDWITSDVFNEKRYGRIRDANLIINTSCEHMKDMKELKALQDSNAYFAFTSNNMFDIEGHTNCVNNIEQFEQQMPDNAKVLVRDSITDDRGTRFMLIGKLYEKNNL